MERLLPYFSFAGRANRQRYWLMSLAIWGLTIVGVLIGTVIPVVGWVMVVAVFVAGMWAGLGVASRRLHDRNKSAWWLLPLYLLPTLLSVFGEVASQSDPEAGLGFAALSLPFSLWALVELGVLKGTAGPNRFGPDPLQPTPAEVFS